MTSENKKNSRYIWIILAVILIGACCLIISLTAGVIAFTKSKDNKKDAPISEQPATSGESWLVMLYQDADDMILEEDIFFDFNEAELVGSSERVHIVSQIDRYASPDSFAGDGDWSSAKRYYLTQDQDLEHINATLLADLGEINMGDPETLIDFVSWSVETYPADRYALILSDHGAGWAGGWSDPDPDYQFFSMNDLDYALGQSLAQAQIDKFDLIGYDACLMSQLDVYTVSAPYARFAVASEETEPATGWAYTAFLQDLVADPKMDGRQLAVSIVDSYLEQDQRIINDSARARLTQGNTEITAQDILDLLLPTATLSAVDLAYIPEVNQALNEYARYMTTVDQTRVAAARSYATSFTSPFGKDTEPSFIDLINFSHILEYELGDSVNSDPGNSLRNALSKAVVKNKIGDQIAGAQGISIYFPNASMYTDEYGGYQVYTIANNRFMNDTLWDEFLAYHYANVAFDPESKTATIPERSADVVGPGVGNIQIADIDLSTDTVRPGDVLSFNTSISGNNICYVYMQYGWLAKDIRTMLVVLGMDYIRADETREVMGVYYPNWDTSGEIPIYYEFEPRLFFITDGSENNLSFIEVIGTKYGKTEDDVQITVPGIFTFANGGRNLYAEINFNNEGELVEVLGYTGQIEIINFESEFEGLFQIDFPGPEGTGDPYPLTPSVGDTFTPFFIGYLIEDEIYVNVESDPIKFSSQPFFLAAEPASMFDIEFSYYTGVAVEDLDGNLTDAIAVGIFDVID